MRLAARLTMMLMALALGVASIAAPASAAGWSQPSKVSGAKLLHAVSCPSRNFCMAVGGGQAVAYRYGVWGSAHKIDPSHTGINDGLITVSCVSSSFCVAGDGIGNVFMYDGSDWSPPKRVANDGWVQLSCGATTFCGAVDKSGKVRFYDGSSWSTPRRVAPATQANVISCRFTGFCMALDVGTDAYRFSGGSWTHAGSLETSNPHGGSEPNVPSAVSCSGPHFCAALDDFGEAFTWTGSGWSEPHRFDRNLLAGSDAVSCPARKACMAVDGTGIATKLTGTTWSPKTQIDPSWAGLIDVSCSSGNFCIAVDLHARALTYR